jgi:quercetin dioxygenase-like cupin family protein
MREDTLRVTRWHGPAPDAAAMLHQYAVEGLRPYQWANNPGDQYAAHVHPYDKILYVVRGSLTFGLPERGEALELYPGDRLDLPAGTLHDAVVGPDGVICLEAHRPS